MQGPASATFVGCPHRVGIARLKSDADFGGEDVLLIPMSPKSGLAPLSAVFDLKQHRRRKLVPKPDTQAVEVLGQGVAEKILPGVSLAGEGITTRRINSGSAFTGGKVAASSVFTVMPSKRP